MKMYYIILLFITLTACYQQKDRSEQIIGKWVGTESTKIFLGDTTYSNNIVQNIFLKDSVLWGFTGEDNFDVFAYSMFTDSLYINNERIKIIELNDSSLIYQREGFMSNSFEIRHFKKVEGMEW